ncbi:DASS family sodium-coupled anion symporter [Serratia sp. DD3]|uniref:DASS family sodium-coupled anion symporter n=1 Tax=Serratia sp. DD3 TaxID=1410619 RepID=UPI0004D68A71|nr:DASS family sodium-coupled anion symporter [Serratia sp. DD3]KEY56479.1 putative malate transporter YflS [Serratia sp. DD3]KEY56699.1 putative malate transporter YflS [Serratia sp. DD3]KEY58368.1 putative malate transporter YflS [Serratia sp. DD3]KEY59410.1 putative malate transporter YflS [Serratia sp. DD3]
MVSNVKWLPLTIIIVLALIFWNIAPPEGLKLAAWHSLVLFVATIISIVINVLPIGAVGIIAITVYVVLNAGGDATAADAIKTGLRNMNNSTIWLIVVAFLIARGFIKTGLGRRISLILITLLGKRTLGLAYGLALADLILAPAMPSNTARCGGVLYPVADSLARSFESRPDDASRKKIGTFLVTCMGNINDVTSAMFMTAFTGNLLIVKLAANENITLTWTGWLVAAVVPCLVSFILIPLVIYFFTARPEIKHTPDAPKLAKQQLAEMGGMSKPEWMMAGTVVVLLVLWIFYKVLNIDPTTGAFIGLSLLLLSGVLSWKDVISEKGAWDTLIWFAALLMMADQLKDLGFMSWFGNTVGQEVSGLAGNSNWIVLLVVLNAVYLYAHYFFASGNAQIVALYSVFLTLGIQLGIPSMPMALMLAFSSSFSCSLTQYTHARGPILFAPGYVPTATWWSTGFVCSVVNQLVLLTVGLAWWKFLGLY